MRAIGIGMILFTIRNVVPLYDLEQRRLKLGNTWHFLVLFQALATIMNLQIVNNLFDRSLFFELVMIASLFSGVYYGSMMKTESNKELLGNTSIELTLVVAIIVFRMFLYIQKRVHKEVFFEMK